MYNNKAIPLGYMTVGEIAKRMGVTVRTLQYYDKEGVLPPSSESEGGRRLYTNKDIVRLNHIQSMKYLGFSLADIKTRLPLINTPEEVASVLTEQAQAIREKISSLTDVLESIEKLNAEVLQMKTVDWERYADIIILLQNKNESYWAMKHFDGRLLEHIRGFDDKTGRALMHDQMRLFKKANELIKKGISPESEQGQAFAEELWNMLTEFTKGDLSLLPELSKISEKEKGDKWHSQQDFFGKALTAYFTNLGYELNGFEEHG